MSPKADFVLLSTVLAFALMASAYAFVAGSSASLPTAAEWLDALKWAPAAGLAAGLAALGVQRWHRRAVRQARSWSPGGMTLRMLLLAFLLFPPAVALWVLAVGALDQWFAAQPTMPLLKLLDWLPVIVMASSLSAVLFGAVPAFVLEYFVCRRYLRRQSRITTGIA